MSEWKDYRLGDIATLKYGKLPPKDSNIGSYPIWSGYRYIGFCNTFNCPKHTPIVVARGVGGTGDVKIAKENCFLTNLSISVSLLKEVCNPFFFTYLFSIDNLRYLDSGSAQSQITIDALSKIKICLPPLAEQKKIAAILSSLDDKIETNRRINQRLKALAQALFKSWFIDYEPFGGSMPQDWEVCTLGDLTVQCNDKVKDKDDVRVLSPVSSGDLVLSDDLFTKQVYSKELSKYLIVAPLSFAYNPARINIGSIGINKFDFDGCVSPVYVVFKAIPDFHEFINHFTKTKQFKDEVSLRAIGGVRQTLNYSDFSLIEIVKPTHDVILKFNENIAPLYDKISNLEMESAKLATLRDALLPKLMSGELKPE